MGNLQTSKNKYQYFISSKDEMWEEGQISINAILDVGQTFTGMEFLGSG